ATLFLPLALASLVWPSTSAWCRRLLETIAALVLSKFVIVAVLSLAVGALSGASDSIAAELAGGALLLVAAFTPFTLIRLVPVFESGAVMGLERAVQRAGHHALDAPRSVGALALGQIGSERLPDLAFGGAEPHLVSPMSGDSDPRSPTALRSSSHDDLLEEPSEDPPGPPPVWGAPINSKSKPIAPRGEHRIEHDDLGPVIRWHASSKAETHA
ncbi:MAG: hypothetical protein ACRDVP_06410, partial [Acidimicrobiales bacterium]